MEKIKGYFLEKQSRIDIFVMIFVAELIGALVAAVIIGAHYHWKW